MADLGYPAATPAALDARAALRAGSRLSAPGPLALGDLCGWPRPYPRVVLGLLVIQGWVRAIRQTRALPHRDPSDTSGA